MKDYIMNPIYSMSELLHGMRDVSVCNDTSALGPFMGELMQGVKTPEEAFTMCRVMSALTERKKSRLAFPIEGRPDDSITRPGRTPKSRRYIHKFLRF
ncbi:hypothetical protein NDU88_005892 [Pleurodeles waltl]|uniref:Uncharacterized protein n=1 Tax=Pleurodeles waltl TaxID=8319 RepID=A0AAV7L2M3_PLEWA|nr:hypothetical protein NDU88_005892 [Pleurodeles waltl]